MYQLLVQKYLETHTFGELARDHGVYASFSKSGHKFSLNYDQIEAQEADPLSQDCRGLILALPSGQPIPGVQTPEGKTSRDDVVPGATQILAHPMRRFFNYGQGTAANIDWADPKLTVLEKLDGTLCIVYWDPFTNKWCVATRSVPEADLPMDNGIFTFRTLFEKALTDTTGYDFNLGFSHLLDKHHTYCFELTTPYNRIVVYYPKNTVTLLAVRNLVTGSELEFDHPVVEALIPRVPLVQAHSLGSVEKTLEWVSAVNPMEHEGVVVKQGENRIKVKSPAYVAYNKVRDSLATSPRNMVELILAEKDDDVSAFLPEEIVKNLQKIKKGLQVAIRDHESVYKQLLALELKTKKDFAITLNALASAKDNKLWTAPFFNMFDGKSSGMRDFIQKNRKDGTWGNSFLDKMLELSQKYGD